MMMNFLMLDLASPTFWHPLPVTNCGQHHKAVPDVKSFPMRFISSVLSVPSNHTQYFKYIYPLI